MAEHRAEWPTTFDLHRQWPTDQQWRDCIAILSACVEANKADDRAHSDLPGCLPCGRYRGESGPTGALTRPIYEYTL
jgi:hypothetical protein